MLSISQDVCIALLPLPSFESEKGRRKGCQKLSWNEKTGAGKAITRCEDAQEAWEKQSKELATLPVGPSTLNVLLVNNYWVKPQSHTVLPISARQTATGFQLLSEDWFDVITHFVILSSPVKISRANSQSTKSSFFCDSITRASSIFARFRCVSWGKSLKVAKGIKVSEVTKGMKVWPLRWKWNPHLHSSALVAPETFLNFWASTFPYRVMMGFQMSLRIYFKKIFMPY